MLIDEAKNEYILKAEAIFQSENATLNELAQAYNELLSSHKEGNVTLEEINDARKELRVILEKRLNLFSEQFNHGEKSVEFINDFILLIRMLSIVKYQIQLSINQSRAEELLENSILNKISILIEFYNTDNSFLTLSDLAHMLLKLKTLVTTEQ